MKRINLIIKKETKISLIIIFLCFFVPGLLFVIPYTYQTFFHISFFIVIMFDFSINDLPAIMWLEYFFLVLFSLVIFLFLWGRVKT
ncbi:MAG: hypothetical protein MUF50_01890 [Planctomycetes bacterium]|jgi:hypothetical protein|nr:hypothetical protein [Planctomycetota bacterium]